MSDTTKENVEVPAVKTLFALGFVWLVACGPDKKPASSAQSSKNGVLAGNDQTGVLALAEKAKTTFRKTLELAAENSMMCKRAAEQRNNCPVAATSLRPTDDAMALGCEGVDANNLSNFEMDIAGPAGGKVFLTTKNETWQTTPVGSGQKQKLVWGPKKSNPCATIKPLARNMDKLAVRSPRVIELSDLFLNFDPDSCSDERVLRAADVPSFKLSIGGVEVFNRSDLVDSPTGVRISMAKLLDSSLNTKCLVAAEDLERELQKVRKSSAEILETASEAPKKSQKILDSDFAREVNRNQQLRTQLIGKENIGCWGYTKIRKFQVRLEGEEGENVDLGLSGAALADVGNSRAYDFHFGQSMVYSTADETMAGIFKKGGGFVTGDFSDREVQELRNIRIVKNGLRFINSIVMKEGFIGIGAWSGHHRAETDIRKLNSLTIFANDQLVYRKTDINFSFQGGNLVWPPNNGIEAIQTSEAFTSLMRRNDCPAEVL